MMRRCLTWMLSLLLVACTGMPPSSPVGPGSRAGAAGPSQDVLVQGRMVLPGFRTQASGSDMMAKAIVSLIDKDGKPVASGLTDASGAFTLFRPTIDFLPTTGEFYRLEIIKRMDRPSGTGTLLSVQSILKRLDDTWDSISGYPIVVNLLTTAVSLYAKEDGLTNFDPVMGLVPGPNYTLADGFGTHTVNDIWGRAAILTQMLQSYADPVTGQDDQLPTHVYTGDIVITDAASLTAAQSYDKIVGNLTIAATAPDDVALPNLLWVTGNVSVPAAATRTRLAWPMLRRVDGDLDIQQQDALTTLQTDHLSVVTQSLRLQSLPALTALALPALERVGADCRFESLKDGTGMTLASLASVGGVLRVATPVLSALSFPKLAEVTSLEITGVAGATATPLNLDLTKLTHVASLDVRNNQLGVIDLSALTQSTGDVSVSENGPDGKPVLANLGVVGGSLRFSTAASSITFGALQSVGSDVVVTACPRLTSLDLPGMTTIPGSLKVDSSPLLATLKFFNLKSVGQDLAVAVGATGLIDGMNLQSVGRHLSVAGPASALQLMGLKTVGGNVSVVGTHVPALVLSQLQSVAQTLDVHGNTAMSAMVAPVLRTVGGNLIIANNPMLPVCQTSTLKNALIGFTGTTDFTGNQGTDCAF